MGRGPGARELFYVITMALAGVMPAATVAFGPWFPGPSVPASVVVSLVSPGGVAGRP